MNKIYDINFVEPFTIPFAQIRTSNENDNVIY